MIRVSLSKTLSWLWQELLLVDMHPLWYQHSWHSHGQMLGTWATYFDFPSWYSPGAQSIGLHNVASLSAAPLSHSSFWSVQLSQWPWQALTGLWSPPGSLCSQTSPTINNHGVSAVRWLLSSGYKSDRPLPHSQLFPGVCKLTQQNRISLLKGLIKPKSLSN